MENSSTYSPQDLIKDPAYKNQIEKIDSERFKQERESFEELLRQNRITKEDNGTTPIIVEIKEPEVGKDSLRRVDENGDEIISPIHERRQVEEYFIKTDAEQNPKTEELKAQEPEISLAPEEALIGKDETEVDLSPIVDDSEEVELTEKSDEAPVKLSTENIPTPNMRPKMRPDNLKSPYKADWDGRSVGEKYTRYTLDAIEKYGQNLLDPGVKMERYKRYCKSYNVLKKDERRRFWLMMISGLSRLESGFRSHTKFTEGFKVSSTSDANVISRGLMQMSIDSIKSRKYKCHKRLGINSTKDLHDPRKNLACAVIVMNYWAKEDKKLYGFSWRKCDDGSAGCRTWYGVGRYWGPIRIERYEKKNMTESQRDRQEEREDLGRKTNNMSFCR